MKKVQSAQMCVQCTLYRTSHDQQHENLGGIAQRSHAHKTQGEKNIMSSLSLKQSTTIWHNFVEILFFAGDFFHWQTKESYPKNWHVNELNEKKNYSKINVK